METFQDQDLLKAITLLLEDIDGDGDKERLSSSPNSDLALQKIRGIMKMRYGITSDRMRTIKEKYEITSKFTGVDLSYYVLLCVVKRMVDAYIYASDNREKIRNVFEFLEDHIQDLCQQIQWTDGTDFSPVV